MNTVSQHIINKRSRRTKSRAASGSMQEGCWRRKSAFGVTAWEQGSYRSLVWLGRPAKTASMLTDLASKLAETRQVKKVKVAYGKPVWNYAPSVFGGAGNLSAFANPFAQTILGSVSTTEWEWKKVTMEGFLGSLKVEYVPSRISHTNPAFGSFHLMTEDEIVRAATPPILMTAAVWKGFRSDAPDDPIIKNGWIKRVCVKTPGYNDAVFGGNVIFTSLKG